MIDVLSTAPIPSGGVSSPSPSSFGNRRENMLIEYPRPPRGAQVIRPSPAVDQRMRTAQCPSKRRLDVAEHEHEILVITVGRFFEADEEAVRDRLLRGIS